MDWKNSNLIDQHNLSIYTQIIEKPRWTVIPQNKRNKKKRKVALHN